VQPNRLSPDWSNAKNGPATALFCRLPVLGVFATLTPMLKKMLPLLLLPLLAGCAAQITNLTPRQQLRNPNNLYPVEVAFGSRAQALNWKTIKPQVVIDGQSYEMHPTLLMTNRWEGMVPAPAGSDAVHYHYRFDFESAGFGKPNSDSAVSPEYTLKLLEPQP
jgi:hypothetical protein